MVTRAAVAASFKAPTSGGSTGRPKLIVATQAAVWEALAGVEDPEIPVISIVDLGVVREVQVDGERVHVEFTPTFLGCPALEVMRDNEVRRLSVTGGDRADFYKQIS